MSIGSPPVPGRLRHRRVLVPTLIYVGLLVAMVSSLGAPLVPIISADYRVSLGDAQWSLTITLLVGAVVAPVIGRLGDGPRRQEVLLTALGVLVAGSALAAVATGSFALFLTGRGMQGVGVALLPLTMSVARDNLPVAPARRALASLSVTTVVGVGLGYPVIGLIAEHANFRIGYWLAAGLGVLAMTLIALVVPRSTHRSRQKLDVPGAASLGLGLACLLLAISESERWGWASLRLWGLIAVAVLAAMVFVRVELSRPAPLVDLRLTRDRAVLTANVTGMLAGVGMYMLLSMIIRYVQTPTSQSYGLGASVFVAGLVLLPLSVMSFLSSRLVALLSRWVSAQQMLPLGALALAAAMLLFATERSHLWEIFVAMGVAGLGVGSTFSVLPTIIVGAVPADETSSALALNQVIRMVGLTVGSAVGATILTAHTIAPSLLPTNAGYTDGALVGVALCLSTAVLSRVLPARRATPAPMSDELALAADESSDATAVGVVAYSSPARPSPAHASPVIAQPIEGR